MGGCWMEEKWDQGFVQAFRCKVKFPLQLLTGANTANAYGDMTDWTVVGRSLYSLHPGKVTRRSAWRTIVFRACPTIYLGKSQGQSDCKVNWLVSGGDGDAGF